MEADNWKPFLPPEYQQHHEWTEGATMEHFSIYHVLYNAIHITVVT